VLGGVETGGTYVSCAVGTGPDDLRAVTRFATTTPGETVDRIAAFFGEHAPVRAVGVGSFGPVDADPDSAGWGRVTTTPKPGWHDAPVATILRGRLGVPVAFDTDVNAAALGEWRWGAGRGAQRLVYVTVGTGIGAGVVVGGRTLATPMHPEAGHMLIPHDRERDPFPGACPYHGDCWEGLACGPAIQARWGVPGADLPDDHPAWELEAHYLALGVVNLALVLAPDTIVLGGGVLARGGLLERVGEATATLLAGYRPQPSLVAPQLDGRQGVLGAIALAEGAAAA
jgi:fructokinase